MEATLKINLDFFEKNNLNVFLNNRNYVAKKDVYGIYKKIEFDEYDFAWKYVKVKYIRTNYGYTLGSFVRKINFNFNQNEKNHRYEYVKKQDRTEIGTFYQIQKYEKFIGSEYKIYSLIYVVVNINDEDEDADVVIFENEREAKSFWLKINKMIIKEEKKQLKKVA